MAEQGSAPQDGVDVLVADDDPHIELVMGELLAGEGRRIHYAHSGREALRLLRRIVPAAVLLDVELGDMTGFEIAQLMRSNPRLVGVPVVFMSGHATEVGSMLAGYDLGAVDYLVKPLIPQVVRGKVAALCELARAHQQVLAQRDDLMAVREELLRANRSLAELAGTDPLTGLANRRQLSDRLQQGSAGQRRRKDPDAVIVIDLDGFKAINDTYGHEVGDQVLVQAAARLRAVCREGDYAARLGGDEFCLVVHGVGQQDLGGLARRMTDTMARPYEVGDQQLSCPASVGAAALDDSQEDPAAAALAQADAAMYRDKSQRAARAGR